MKSNNAVEGFKEFAGTLFIFVVVAVFSVLTIILYHAMILTLTAKRDGMNDEKERKKRD